MALTATATRGFERVRNLSLVPVNPNLYELTPNTAFVEGDMVVDSAGKIAKAAANATNVRGVMAARTRPPRTHPTNGPSAWSGTIRRMFSAARSPTSRTPPPPAEAPQRWPTPPSRLPRITIGTAPRSTSTTVPPRAPSALSLLTPTPAGRLPSSMPPMRPSARPPSTSCLVRPWRQAM